MNSKYNDSRDATFNELYEIALEDPNVIVLSVDTGALIFKEFKKNIPEQFHFVGIAEQNAMSVAAGLALTGKHVFVFGISNFVTTRCFEQIKIDICSMNASVTILGMGTGYVYNADGPTHHMTEDVSIMRSLPNMKIFSPSDYAMTSKLVHLAYKTKGPSYLRIDKGPFKHLYKDGDNFSDGLSVLKEGRDIKIIATGIMVQEAMTIVEELDKIGIDVGLVDVYRLKPINKEKLATEIKKSDRIVTLEEHTIQGGLGSIVLELMSEKEILRPVKLFGIPDVFQHEVGSRAMLRSICGFDNKTIIKLLAKRN